MKFINFGNRVLVNMTKVKAVHIFPSCISFELFEEDTTKMSNPNRLLIQKECNPLAFRAAMRWAKNLQKI